MQDETFPGERVTHTRRFFGDLLLESVLQVLTLGIGWLIWFAIVARSGRTPAKQLLNVYVYDYESRDVASAGRVWMREIVAKSLIPAAISLAILLATGSEPASNLGSIYTLIAGIMILSNSDRRALWDHIAGTTVRYLPEGSEATGAPLGSSATPHDRLQELESLRSRGTITQAEYEAKRKEILASI